GSPVISSVQEEGISYTEQRHEFFLFARRPGKHDIPPITIRLQFKRNPLDKEPIMQSVQTPSFSLTATSPPGAENLGGIICARGLDVEETWKPQPDKAKAGDAFTRTITFRAPDVPAMAFPEFPVGEVDGLGIYRKPPEVLDKSDRGSLLGQRRDTLIYVCQRPGRFVIPAVKLTWWDLQAKQLQTLDFPSRTIDVAPNPALATASVTQAAPVKDWPRLALISLGIMFGLSLSGYLIWKTRELWRGAFASFRPVHLVPLNPESEGSPK